MERGDGTPAPGPRIEVSRVDQERPGMTVKGPGSVVADIWKKLAARFGGNTSVKDLIEGSVPPGESKQEY